MLRAIRDFFRSHLADDKATQPDVEQRTRLATAALLIEMTRADRQVTEAERQAVDAALREVFALGTGEAAELVRLAELEVKQASSLFQFTHLVDKAYPMERKIHIVELLWRVAYSDSCKDHHEEHLVRKIADLLHVPHSAFILARHRAEERK
ncbi:MAG: TerB family tellurite resistance protein [Gammaproteobacteria bacterium]|jgi:uncharacterized tellurite resistance protein B-like protein|nr:TerB family tellurite resistance protein [Gammaproteobacteria bacterium]